MSYASEVTADNPLIWWRLDDAGGNFVDATGHTADATAYGDPYDFHQPPGINAGYSIFNDTNSRAATATAVSFTNANIWTVEAWIKTSTALLMGIVEMSIGSVQFRVSDSPAGYLQLVRSFLVADGVSTISVADGLWHHVVGRRTGGVSTLWIDGVDRSGTMANPSYDPVTGPVGFGALWSGSAQTPSSPYLDSEFKGGLDEIAIYDSALSDARILAHYQAGTEVGAQAPWLTTL